MALCPTRSAIIAQYGLIVPTIGSGRFAASAARSRAPALGFIGVKAIVMGLGDNCTHADSSPPSARAESRMQALPNVRVTLSVEEAHALARRALSSLGFDADEATIVADHVVDAALCGYEYSGLPKILNLAEHPGRRHPRRPLTAVHETNVSARLDGGNTNGMLAMVRATDIAIAKATAH